MFVTLTHVRDKSLDEIIPAEKDGNLAVVHAHVSVHHVLLTLTLKRNFDEMKRHD